MSPLSGRLGPAISNQGDGQSRSEVTSHALNSDLEDQTPGGSGSSTSRSDYSPCSQPFAERPENRTVAGVAARQTLSSLPSPPPFTPLAGLVSPGQMSGAGSNDKPCSPGTAGDTPGVTSAWQPGLRSPGSSSVTFAFNPVAGGDVASPDAQPFGRGVEQGSAAQRPPAPPAVQLPKAADVVRAVERRLSASHDSDAMSDASGSVTSTTSTQRSLSSGLPAGSPGDILRAATSKLSAQHAISGSSRIQNPQRRKSGALKTPLQQKLAPAPTPHSTPMDPAEVQPSDEQDTAESAAQKAPSLAGAAAAGGLPPSSNLKVHVVGSPVVASPSKQSTKSPGSVGSRSSVVSIGSVCGAAALTPLQAMAPGGDELEAGRYTPTMKLDFGGSPARTPATALRAGAGPGKPNLGKAAVAASTSPAQCSDVGGSATPAKSPPATPTDGTPVELLPDDLTGMVEKMQFSGNKSVLRDAFTASDVGGLQDQLQALLDEAGEEAQAALGVKPTPAGAAAAGAATTTAASSRPGVSTRGSWFSRSRGTLLLLLAGLCILLGSMVAVQMLPVTVLPPGAMCTPQNAAACKAALAAQLAAADKEPSRLRRAMLEAKWYAQDVFTIFWTRRLPEGVTLDQAQQVWLSNVSSKQIAKMTTAEAEALFGSVPEHLRSPAISAKLAASAAQKAQLDAARKAAERAEVQRIAAAKAEAERRTAEEARIAREKAEAARLAKEAEEQRKAQEKAEAERVAREKAEAEQRAQEKADAERRAAEQARLAEERAEAARQAAERAEAERKAEQARLAAEAAEAERLATERAASAEREAAARLASEQAERAAAAAAKAKRRAALLLPIMGLFVILLGIAGGAGYMWRQAAMAKQQGQQEELDEIRTMPDDDLAYQNLGDEDEGAYGQKQAASGAAASAAAAVAAAGAAAAGALAAGVQEAAAVATRILTPRLKAPPPPDLAGQQPDAGLDSEEGEEEAAPARRGRRAASGRAAAAARTPSSARRGSRAAAAAGADSGVDSDAGASTGRARSTRGGKTAAATPGRALAPLMEDAPAEPADALTSGDEAAAAAEEEEAPRRGTRRQSAPAASRRRTSTAAAAATEAATEAATPTLRRTSRQARTPRV